MASAAIAAGASLLGGITGGKGAAKAAAIQADAFKQGLAQQQAQWNQTQTNLRPFLNLGTSAVNPLGNLVGVNGNDAQQAAITQLQGGPLFSSLVRNGENAILANAAATGGLRGGNTQNSLANFRSDTLANVIQQQLGNLGGLLNTGVGAANSLGTFGQNNANAQSTLMGQIGNANAVGAAAPYAAFGSALGQVDFNKILSGIRGGGGGITFQNASDMSNNALNAIDARRISLPW